MKTKQILIALAALALLSAYLYFFGIKKKADEQKAKDAANSLFPGAERDAAAEAVFGLKKTVLSVKRSGSGWDIVKPFAWPADKSMVEAVLLRILSAKADRKIEGAVLADYNLNTPPVYAAITMNDGKKYKLYMSDYSPTGNLAYGLKEGDNSAVYMLPKSIRDDLDREQKVFRYKGLLRYAEGSETKIEVNVEGKKYTAEKQGEDWYVTSPGPRKLAKKDRFTTVFNNMINSGVKEYYDISEAGKYGLQNPAEYVKIHEGNTVHAVYFGKKDKKNTSVFATSSFLPGVVEAGDYIYSSIAAFSELYNKQVLIFKQDDVMEQKVRYGEKSITSKRNKPGKNPDWLNTEIKGLDNKALESYRPANVFGAIFWAEYTDKIEKPETSRMLEYGFSPPSAEITLKGKGGKTIGVILIGNKNGADGVYVKTAGSDTVYTIPVGSFNNMGIPLLVLK